MSIARPPAHPSDPSPEERPAHPQERQRPPDSFMRGHSAGDVVIPAGQERSRRPPAGFNGWVLAQWVERPGTPAGAGGLLSARPGSRQSVVLPSTDSPPPPSSHP